MLQLNDDAVGIVPCMATKLESTCKYGIPPVNVLSPNDLSGNNAKAKYQNFVKLDPLQMIDLTSPQSQSTFPKLSLYTVLSTTINAPISQYQSVPDIKQTNSKSFGVQYLQVILQFLGLQPKSPVPFIIGAVGCVVVVVVVAALLNKQPGGMTFKLNLEVSTASKLEKKLSLTK
ncbi:MAG: hypothetical protein PUP91_16745 [Rhizonema sp. PD37]|nr:hypothetical protein [Rhizonema sp. PD37]